MNISKSFKYLLILSSLLTIACSSQPEASNNAEQVAQPQQQAVAAQPAPQSQPATPSAKSGTVKSTQVAGAYSYIETDINGQVFWIATAATNVTPGQQISWNDHAVMNNFNSKALNRTFEQILFIDKVMSPQASSNAHAGTVLEAHTSAGYSYLHVQQNDDKMWLAAPAMIINPGQTIRWTGGATMQNFTSKSLNKTFDKIIFVNAVEKTAG